MQTAQIAGGKDMTRRAILRIIGRCKGYTKVNAAKVGGDKWQIYYLVFIEKYVTTPYVFIDSFRSMRGTLSSAEDKKPSVPPAT